MTMTMDSDEKSRNSDVCGEPVDRLLAPIRGYEDKPLLPLIETIEPISILLNDIQDYAFVALHNCQNPVDDLTQQESAAIHLYTMQFHGESSLYQLLNQSLRAENRDDLKPWFLFLKLFLTALYKLPSERKIVWRGVKNADLSLNYKIGMKIACWGVSSCTTNIQVLESDTFLGKTGERTIFSIECVNGKSIENHSYFKNKEKEIILMPGSYFEVIGQLNPAPQLYIIQLREITPPIAFVKPPFYKPKNITNTPSIENKPSILSQILPKRMFKKMSSDVTFKNLPLKSNKKWKQRGITVAGGYGWGNQLNQFYCPYNICIDDNQTIYIADCWNDRIVEWKRSATKGQIVAGGNGDGNEINQLNGPTDVIIDQETNSLIIADAGNRRVMQWSRQSNINKTIIISDIDCRGLAIDKDGSLYVSDPQKNEVRRWRKGETGQGTVVAGGNNKGDKFDQLNFSSYIFVDDDYSLYVSDRDNHRVIKWMKDANEGIVVAGGNGQGNSLRQLSCPAGIFVNQFGQIYVADSNNNRVVCWCQGAVEGAIVVGGNGCGAQTNQFNYPRGLTFDRQGNLYIVDERNYRIQKFDID